MDKNIFRKEDATSCLVVDKSWDQILDKPDFFTELGKRIVEMTSEAERVGILTRETTLKYLKQAINDVLLIPLQKDEGEPGTNPIKSDESILADAFWDEISHNDSAFKGLKEAIEKAAAMKKKIGELAPLTDASTLQDTKDAMNEAVLKPLRGINEDE